MAIYQAVSFAPQAMIITDRTNREPVCVERKERMDGMRSSVVLES
jgi:hypothetical protein